MRTFPTTDTYYTHYSDTRKEVKVHSNKWRSSTTTSHSFTVSKWKFYFHFLTHKIFVYLIQNKRVPSSSSFRFSLPYMQKKKQNRKRIICSNKKIKLMKVRHVWCSFKSICMYNKKVTSKCNFPQQIHFFCLLYVWWGFVSVYYSNVWSR